MHFLRFTRNHTTFNKVFNLLIVPAYPEELSDLANGFDILLFFVIAKIFILRSAGSISTTRAQFRSAFGFRQIFNTANIDNVKSVGEKSRTNKSE